jgi:branched-chain amino acid transport system substrate-binding protein
MNEQGVAAYIGCFQSPVGIAASQAASKYNTPFLIDVGASDLIVSRGLKNVFRLKPGFGVCVDDGIASLGALNKAAGNIAKSAVIVHESGEFGTGTAKLLQGKLPSIGIEAKELIAHDNPTRNFDNIALRIRSLAPDVIMMSNYGNEYMLLARTLYQQKVNVAGFYSILGGGFNYKFVKEMPDVSQYMMDVNHWYNPKSTQAQELKKRVEASGALFTFEVYLTYTNVMLLADALERAASADKEKLTAALAASTFKAELMPYGPTKFVNGQNQGGKPGVMQALKGDIDVIAPEEFASAKAVFPKPKLN